MSAETLSSPNTLASKGRHAATWPSWLRGVPLTIPVSWWFGSAIFTSAFLIFQVQPLVSKYILPWFGGTPAVWSACLLFFQVVLFAGYTYAHLLTVNFAPRGQALIHGLVLVAAILTLPIVPSDSWKPTGDEAPIPRILALLAATVGLPYFALSATGPLLQRWFSLTNTGGSPYRLYALSNLGSVLGLVSYPFIVEPLLSAPTQAGGWSIGFVGYAVLAALCGYRLFAKEATGTSNDAATTIDTAAAPSIADRGLWFGLAAAASVLLLAITNQVCLDVAVIPFLWVLPLTQYLLSFILCFDGSGWYPRRAWLAAAAAGVACTCVMMFAWEVASLTSQVVVYFSTLFFCCMVCHGELALLRPNPKHLTSYYMAMSAGGAMGGVFTSLIAPQVFSRYLELHLGLIGFVVVTLLALRRDRNWVLAPGKNPVVWCGLLLMTLTLVKVLRAHAGEVVAGEIDVSRNFYGVLKVAEVETQDPRQAARVLIHGHIMHGRQFLAEDRRSIPTAYYGEQTAVGQTLAAISARHPQGVRVGVVGLGVGTLATYGRPGDVYRLYEINPDVVRVARQHFRFLTDSKARCEVVTADARLALEREAPQRFDLLVLDAFSSDAIPTHLLSAEAFSIYKKHLSDEGAIAIHISNRHFDLAPVLDGAARSMGWSVRRMLTDGNADRAQQAADWMLLGPAGGVVHYVPTSAADTVISQRGPLLWTDQYSPVLGIMK
jgi:hypothetical protein